jgi:glycosyltransferase involved in cell wall biosynthesis
MKIGVFLGDFSQASGGGYSFQEEIFHAILRTESRHTFVVFGNLEPEKTGVTDSRNIVFIDLRRGLLDRVKFTFTHFIRSMISRLPIIRKLSHGKGKDWFHQIIDDLGIDVMWFVTLSYVEVDIPYIFTVLDLQHRLQPWFPEVSADGRWRSREEHYATAIRRATAVISGAEAGKKDIVHFYRIPPERIKLIPHPTPRFALNAPEGDGKEVLAKYNIPDGYLFYPAQFWPHKNHIGLLLAVQLLREKFDLTLPMVFVGSDQGNLRYVRKIVDELGLSDQVHILGFVPQDDLVSLYRNAFTLTYMTFFGPENLPPLEAFALGCPVIASNVPGAQEQLGDAAILVDPKDEEQIASAIKSLHSNPDLRQKIIQRGLERAVKWTGDDFVKAVLSIIDEFEPFRRCWSSKGPYVIPK